MIANYTVNIPELPINAWIAMGAAGLFAILNFGPLKKHSKIVLIGVGKGIWGVVRVPKPILSALIAVTGYVSLMLWMTGGKEWFSHANHSVSRIGDFGCLFAILGSLGSIIAIIASVVITVDRNEELNKKEVEDA